MEEELAFKLSAFKHGISEADIRNAFKQRVLDYIMPCEEFNYLLLGLARDASLLEIMYNILTIMPDLNKPGFFARKYGMTVKLDPETTRFLTAQAEATHKNIPDIIGGYL